MQAAANKMSCCCGEVAPTPNYRRGCRLRWRMPNTAIASWWLQHVNDAARGQWLATTSPWAEAEAEVEHQRRHRAGSEQLHRGYDLVARWRSQ